MSNRTQIRPHFRQIDTSLDRIPGLARLILPDPLGLPLGTSRIHRIFCHTILETRWSLAEYEDDITESLNTFVEDMRCVHAFSYMLPLLKLRNTFTCGSTTKTGLPLYELLPTQIHELSPGHAQSNRTRTSKL